MAVADSGDNRILIYNTPLTAGEEASIVIGQTNFTQGLPNQGNNTPTAATLYTPTSLAMDSSGNLWVADDHNCRVLEYQPPFTTGMSASLEIGQPYLGAPPYCGYGDVPEYTYSIGPIAFDSQGDLWVGDGAAGRVVEFVPPFSAAMAPSLAIGQPSLQDSAPCNGGEVGAHLSNPPPTAATLCGPSGIAFDSQGNLWVADGGNLRLLEYVPPFSTGMAASLEMVGQPPSAFHDNGTSCIDTAANNFCIPDAIAFDGDGDLWVAVPDFQRVQEFVPPFSNGMAASMVIGQPNFSEVGPSSLGAAGDPAGLTFDSSGNLIVTGELFTSESGSPPNSTGKIVVYAPPLISGMEPTTIMTSPYMPSPYDCLFAFGATNGGMRSISVSANSLCAPVGVVPF